MRRAEIGHHHHIAGQYLLRYAQEATWREDNRRAANGEQIPQLISAVIGKGTLKANPYALSSLSSFSSLLRKS